MKKVLLITYNFPPIAGAGIQRVLKFVKYLPHHNITPIVFCPKRAYWRVMDDHNLELPYLKKTRIYRCGIKRLDRYYRLRYGRGLQSHPYFYLLALRYIWHMDYFSSWYFECRDQALAVAIEEKVDCILTSSPPHSVHFFGNYLKAKLNIPWLMDLRDAMYDNPDRNLSKLSSRFAACMEGFYEKRFYHTADAIISVSKPILDSIYDRHFVPGFESKMNLITNGFDDEDFDTTERQKKENNKLVITYTGTFLGKRTPEHFLEALSILCFRKEINSTDILVQFIGHFDENVCSVIQNYSTTFTIKIIDHQPYEKALAYQLSSDILLLVNSTDKAEGGDQIFTGKFFEYLGALKPIFALTPDGPLKHAIETGNFGIVAPARDIEAIAKQFKRLYDLWKTKSHIPYNPDMKLRSSFTRKETTKKLAELIQRITETKRTKSVPRE
jgi:glycosyltransferase involved in cell wall biosynthesis